MVYGVAVLGTGRIGGSYIDVVKAAEGARPVVVAEPRQEAVAKLKEKHPDVDFVSDFRDAVNREDVDIIVGTLPHWLHKEAVLAGVEAGKHIYMEKPLAVWARDGEEMLAAARARGVKLMTAHTQRYYPVVKAAKEWIDSGKLGELVMIHDVWYKPYTPYNRPSWMLDRSKGGGMGQMDGTHQIDRILWFAGSDVVSVSAMVGQITYPREQHSKIDCDDTAMLFVRWRSGVVASLARIAWEKGATEYGGDVFLTGGMIRFRIRYGGGSSQETGLWIADTPNGEWRREHVPEVNSFLEEFQSFVHALERGDADTPVPQAHGVRVLEVLEASEESSRLGKEVRL